MKRLILLLALLPYLLYAQSQIMLGPVYNLSNTPGVVFHKVYSAGDYHHNAIYYVIWGDSSQMLIKSSSDFGETWGPEKIVAYEALNPGIEVQLPSFPNYIEYIGVAYQGGKGGVFFKKTSDGGNTWSAVDTLSIEGINLQISGGGGSVHIGANQLCLVWEERPGNISQIFFSRSTNFGTTWSLPVNISNTPNDSKGAQIIAQSNYVYCSWIETSTYPLSYIYFIRSTDNGITWTPPANISYDDRPKKRIHMISSVLFIGNIYMVSEEIPYYPALDKSDVYYRRSQNYGTTWVGPSNISNNPGHSTNPFLLMNGSFVYITWSDNIESAPAYDNFDIYIETFSVIGSNYDDSVKVSSNTENSSNPQICFSIPPDKISVIWHDYVNGDAEIVARNGVHYVPVELTSFTAEVNDNDVMLYWSTATETNNKGFEIERKTDSASDWQTIAFINGNGTTTAPQEYYYTDKNLSYGKYYYRLKQMDYDGSSVYSVEIEASPGVPLELNLSQNYPNPFNPSTIIKYSVASASFVTLKVYDVLGNEIAALVNEEKPPGIYAAEFNGAGLSSGVYFYRLTGGDRVEIKKMIMMK